MSVSLTRSSVATASEVLEANSDSALPAGRTVTHNQFNQAQVVLTGSTTPPVTKCSYDKVALSGGALTLDLTALVGTNGVTVDATGLKLQYFKMKNLGANVMSVTFGAANPYNMMGADFKVTLTQNQIFEFWGNDATPDVAGGAKDMDLSGTSAEEAEISMVFG